MRFSADSPLARQRRALPGFWFRAPATSNSETPCRLRYSLRHADSLLGSPPRGTPVHVVFAGGNPQVRAALDWFPKNLAWINEEQSRLTEIPAPSFQEEKRAAAVKELLAAEGLPVSTDKIGNVIGELRGSNEKEVVLVSAHLDTVFPPGPT